MLSYSENCFTVNCKDGTLRSIPAETLDGISLFGPVQVSTQCVEKCLSRGIGISYYSKNGSYFGRLSSTNHVNVRRQRRQIELSNDNEFKLDLSKKIIKAKINNQKVLLQRYMRSKRMDLSSLTSEIAIYERKIDGCTSIEQIMGYEGGAAKVYFTGLSKLVYSDFKFKGRNRRPPRDAFNSMLSLGYSILLNEVYGELENKGLNPYFGFMHKDREKHPTLASDLMEEWRAVIVDSVVMSLINGHEISIDRFSKREDKPGIFIDKEGMRIFINKKISGKEGSI